MLAGMINEGQTEADAPEPEKRPEDQNQQHPARQDRESNETATRLPSINKRFNGRQSISFPHRVKNLVLDRIYRIDKILEMDLETGYSWNGGAIAISAQSSRFSVQISFAA